MLKINEAFETLVTRYGLEYRQNGSHCMIRSRDSSFKVDFWPSTCNVHVSSPDSGLLKKHIPDYGAFVDFLQPYLSKYRYKGRSVRKSDEEKLLQQQRQHLWIEMYLDTQSVKDADLAVEFFDERFDPRPRVDFPEQEEEEEEEEEEVESHD